MSTLTIPDTFTIEISSGDASSLAFAATGDVVLTNPARSSSGRALVPGANDQLTINFANDFTGGVLINGQVALGNLSDAPPGVETDVVRVDASGNLYRQD